MGEVGRVRPDGTGLTEIALPAEDKRYGHFTGGAPGGLVSDGYYEEEADKVSPGGDGISLIEVDWENGSARWSPLCRHSSSWKSQDEHPHPLLDHSLQFAYFTSDVDGKRAIYRIRVAARYNFSEGADWKGCPAS